VQGLWGVLSSEDLFEERSEETAVPQV
jgi:hypothetical protein